MNVVCVWYKCVVCGVYGMWGLFGVYKVCSCFVCVLVCVCSICLVNSWPMFCVWHTHRYSGCVIFFVSSMCCLFASMVCMVSVRWIHILCAVCCTCG